LDYERLVKSSLDFAKDKNIFVGADRNDVLKNLPKPVASPGTKSSEGDSSITDIFMINGKDFYLTTVDNKDNIFKVKNWRYAPPSSLPETDRIFLFDIQKEPLVELVQYHFDKKDYEKSLYYLNEVLVLEPTNEAANNFVVTIYDAMGKKDEASKRFEELIKKDPNSASFRLGYGNLLMQMEKYDQAILQYEKALEIDPQYYDAMRNIASAYKNKAVLIQKTQKDAVDADQTKKTTMKPDEYMPFINKSGEYFEKSRKSPKYANDVDVLTDLVDIFYVAGQTDKLKVIVAELEAIEQIVPKDKIERYYYQMLKVFQQRLPNPEKSKLYEEKINTLK
jgi:tetratricopeptide (TPR) repeat protein